VSLRQINDKSKQFLPAVGALRNVAGEGASLEAAKSLHPVEFVTALNQVEHTFVRYPIPLLQVVGASPVPFLYEQDWPEGTSITTLRKAGQDRIRLLPEVAHRLVALGPLIRPLIEVQWLGDVSRQNDIDRENRDLHVHLFGSERTAFPVSVVEGLLDLQSGACFYCGASVQKKSVDHFIPWSRWPTDAMENLVLADSHCNSSKGDHLASVRHVDHWQERNALQAAALADLVSHTGWQSNPARVQSLAISTYSNLALHTPLWDEPKVFVRYDGEFPA
jgi:5-methylcytosine-specific restriction endonuclease McrA